MAFFVLYTIEDEDGKQSTTEIKIPSTSVFTNAAIFAAEMAQLIDPLVRGVIRRIGIGFLVDLSGITPALKTAALAGADVEEGARFQFLTDNGFFTSLRLPTFDEAFILPATDQVDLADADVAAFTTAMISGINLVPAGGTGTTQPTSNRDEDLVSLTSALESFQSSRRS